MGSYPFRPDFRTRQSLEEGQGSASESEMSYQGMKDESISIQNPTIHRLDKFFSNGIEVLDYMADTMEKGDDLNRAIERVLTALIKLIMENPIIKAILQVAKEYMVKKAVEALSSPSDSDNSFKELVGTVMERPAIRDFVVEMVAKEMREMSEEAERDEKEDG